MSLTQSLHRQLQQDPDAAYTVYTGGPGDPERTWTVRETVDRVARIAGGLRALGVGSGDHVALLGVNTDTYLQLILAVPWADGVLVPLNVRWSVAELAYALEDSGARVLMVDDAFAPLVPSLLERVPGVDTIVHAGDGTASAGAVPLAELLAAAPVPDAVRTGRQLAGIFYTGGTTGAAKGVMLSHGGMLVAALGAGLASSLGGGMRRGGRTLHVAPLFHLAALSMWLCMSEVDAVHVVTPQFEPGRLLETLERQRVTAAMLVPTMIQLLVDHPSVGDHDLRALELLIYGSSPMTDALIARVRTMLPATRLQQSYGMTELSPTATLLTDAEHDDAVLRRSAGRSLPHVLLRIVDESGRELAPGEIGEIVSHGEHVMLGYWRKRQETAAALRDGWLLTGDAGYLDERGYLFVVDRIKDMVKTGGENVYSIEVENAIARHPAVAQCAVVGVADDLWGERVHAVVVLADRATLTLEELSAHCHTLIAGYKCPRSMEIVTEFPLSAAGKILKRELRTRPVAARS